MSIGLALDCAGAGVAAVGYQDLRCCPAAVVNALQQRRVDKSAKTLVPVLAPRCCCCADSLLEPTRTAAGERFVDKRLWKIKQAVCW
jgi:hypothetical protein